jgi:hypothetical protein
MDDEEWQELVAIEPRLGELLDAVVAADDGAAPRFCADVEWSRRFKQQLWRLVGFMARKDNEKLRSTQAYDLATQKCFAALPPCRGGCGCEEKAD